MNHWLELRGTVWVMCDGIGCQPASDAEIEMWQELAKLRAECEGLLADAMRLDWFHTLTPHKLARIRAQFMPDKSGDIRAAIDAAMGRGESP